MVDAAGAAGAATFLYNPKLKDIPSSSGVMSVRGRDERLAFEARRSSEKRGRGGTYLRNFTGQLNMFIFL